MKLTVLQCISQYTQFRTMFLWEKMRIIFSKVIALDFSIFFLAIQSSAVVRILHYLPKNWHTFSIILKSLSIQNGQDGKQKLLAWVIFFPGVSLSCMNIFKPHLIFERIFHFWLSGKLQLSFRSCKLPRLFQGNQLFSSHFTEIEIFLPKKCLMQVTIAFIKLTSDLEFRSVN